MSKAILALAAFAAIGLFAAPDARAENVSGKIVYIMGFGDATWGTTGGVLGRRADNTYWMVYTSVTTPDAGTGRILTTASATTAGANAYLYFVDHYAGNTGNYLYQTGPATEIVLALP